LGLALSFAPQKAVPPALAAFAALAVLGSLVSAPASWLDGVFLGCWVGVIIAAACVHLPHGLGTRGAVVLSLYAGFWTGAVVAGAGSPFDLVKAMPLALLCVPGAFIVQKGWGLALKVATSWLIAIAILSAALPLVPTPGYKPDHME